MIYEISASCGCHTGKVREKNEDNFYFNDKHLNLKNNALKEPISLKSSSLEANIFAVFDGMGGESGGEKASYTAANTLSAYVKSTDVTSVSVKEYLNKYCLYANKKICERTLEEKYSRMGTTAAILHIQADMVFACNVGDSRIYRFRKNELLQISKDHSDFSSNNRPNAKAKLTQYLGIFPHEMVIQPFIAKGVCQADDRYLICSDGLTDMLSDVEIKEQLAKRDNPKETTSTLMAMVMNRGAKDNITMVIVDIQRDNHQSPEVGKAKGRGKILTGILLLLLVVVIAVSGVYVGTRLNAPEESNLSIVTSGEDRIGLIVGQEQALEFTTDPANQEDSIEITIENPNVAEFQYGTIIAIAVGQTKLTMTDEQSGTVLAEKTITVFPKE